HDLRQRPTAEERLVDRVLALGGTSADTRRGATLRIEVEEKGGVALERQGRRQIDGRGGLPHPALLIRHRDHPAHHPAPPVDGAEATPPPRHPGPTRQLGIDRRLLGSHLHRTDGSERDHANRLAQEARASATGLDEDDLQVGAKAPEHDSRETRAAPYVDGEPRPRDMRGGCERIDRMVPYQTRAVADARQVNAAVPHAEDLEKAAKALERVTAHADAELPP